LQFNLRNASTRACGRKHRGLKDLSLALHEAQSRLDPAWSATARACRPTTGEFAARVTELKQRIDTLQARLGGTEQKQSVFLARLAAHQLEEQKDRLAAYEVQARFALASMYDSRRQRGTPRKGSAGGNQAAPAEETPAPPEQAPVATRAGSGATRAGSVPKAAEPPR